MTEPLALDRRLRPRGLLAGQRHAERTDAVLARGMANHPAPAATDVEQAHAGLEAELAGDQLVLGRLRLVEVIARVAEQRTGVRHGRAEDPLVERVRHVVVVLHRAGVAAPRVPQPLQRASPGRRRLLRRWRRRPQPLPAEPAHQLERLRRRTAAAAAARASSRSASYGSPGCTPRSSRSPRDVRARHAQVAGCGEQVRQATLGRHVQPDASSPPRRRLCRRTPVTRTGGSPSTTACTRSATVVLGPLALSGGRSHRRPTALS